MESFIGYIAIIVILGGGLIAGGVFLSYFLKNKPVYLIVTFTSLAISYFIIKPQGINQLLHSGSASHSHSIITMLIIYFILLGMLVGIIPSLLREKSEANTSIQSKLAAVLVYALSITLGLWLISNIFDITQLKISWLYPVGIVSIITCGFLLYSSYKADDSEAELELDSIFKRLANLSKETRKQLVQALILAFVIFALSIMLGDLLHISLYDQFRNCRITTN